MFLSLLFAASTLTSQLPVLQETTATQPSVVASSDHLSPAGVLTPLRGYYAPGQPMTVKVNASRPVEVVLRDFIGRATSARSSSISGGEIDLQKLFPDSFREGGTYLLFAVPVGAEVTDFLGTPLVISVRRDDRRGAPAGPMIFRVSPLEYAVFSTSAGDLRVCFYYDTAPNTVETIQRLIREKFYEGLDFFRVEPGFIIQTGDPRSDGTGGPGFTQDAEFSDRQHLEGVLALARLSDPNEAPGLLPRSEFANSGGSQFFIALNYEATRQLDRRYTVFARMVDGFKTLHDIASAPNIDNSTRPRNPVKITTAKVVPVTPGDNPYARLQVVEAATTRPTDAAQK